MLGEVVKPHAGMPDAESYERRGCAAETSQSRIFRLWGSLPCVHIAIPAGASLAICSLGPLESLMGRSRWLAIALASICLPELASSFVKVSLRGTATSQELRPSSATSAVPCVPRARQRYRHELQAKKKKSDPGRPSLDDVERLSRGQAAKKRGTGSRGVCHRLNESERKAYDLAKKQGYVVLRGTGYRKERKGSPLQNIFRQFCDAKAMACTSVLTGQGSDAVDEVEIDFSPLRTTRETMEALSEQADAVATELGAPRVELELEPEAAAETADAAVAAASAAAAATAAAFGGEVVASDGADAAETSELTGDEEDQEEEEEEEWTGDPKNRPIWKFPVVSRVYRCDSRKKAKDVAVALASMKC